MAHTRQALCRFASWPYTQSQYPGQAWKLELDLMMRYMRVPHMFSWNLTLFILSTQKMELVKCSYTLSLETEVSGMYRVSRLLLHWTQQRFQSQTHLLKAWFSRHAFEPN